MAEFIIKLADERGRVQEQVQTASTAEELRQRFAHAGYHVFSVKARGGGPDYVFGILTGFKEVPPSFKMLPGMQYNEYFSGHQIAMPPPLSDNAVTFADGVPATVPQMAHDVVTFLTWAAEPNLEVRHRTGFKVMLFLIVTVGIFYAAKRKIWAAVH